jgi:hypothetical protein
MDKLVYIHFFVIAMLNTMQNKLTYTKRHLEKYKVRLCRGLSCSYVR